LSSAAKKRMVTHHKSTRNTIGTAPERGVRSRVAQNREVDVVPPSLQVQYSLEFLITAFLANAMRKRGFWMLLNIGFNLLPIALIIPYFLTLRTHGNEPTEDFNFGEGYLQLMRNAPLFFIGALEPS
jgi:hypothetical protein